MKIVSWNVAGIRACLKKGLDVFFDSVNADIFCMQEVKAFDDQFDFRPEGYTMYLYSAVRKGYSGTLIFSRIEPISVTYGIGDVEYDEEGRNITLEFDSFYLVNCYVPNVKRDLSRMDSRMRYEEKFLEYIKKLEKKKPVVFCGDMNVAHQEIDIKNAKANIGNAGFTYEEREKFQQLLNAGFIDTYRYFYPEKEGMYTWWSYMRHARETNAGWRIDYFLISKKEINWVKDAKIYTDVYGSDHCPIGIELTLN